MSKSFRSTAPNWFNRFLFALWLVPLASLCFPANAATPAPVETQCEFGRGLVVTDRANPRLSWHGDKRVIEESYEAMVRYLDYLRDSRKDGLVRHGLGDWGDHGPGRPGISQLTSPGVTGTAVFYQCLLVVQEMGRAIGRPESELQRFEMLARESTEAFNRTFFKATEGHYDRGSQTAQAMPLALGMTTQISAPVALAALQKNLAAGGYLPTAGDIGLPYVIQALANAGDTETLFRLVTQDDGPGYLYQLRRGMTTLAEAWDVNLTKSLNHCMLGHVEAWFYSHLAGLRPDPKAIGWERFIVAPEPVGNLTWVRVRHQSPRGEILVSWKKSGTTLTLEVAVPPGATAEIVLPGKRVVSATLANGQPAPAKSLQDREPGPGGRPVILASAGTYRFQVSEEASGPGASPTGKKPMKHTLNLLTALLLAPLASYAAEKRPNVLFKKENDKGVTGRFYHNGSVADMEELAILRRFLKLR